MLQKRIDLQIQPARKNSRDSLESGLAAPGIEEETG